MHRLEEHTLTSVYPLLIMVLCVSVCIYRGDCHHHQRPFPSTSQEVLEEEGGTGGCCLCSLLSVWIAKCYSGELLVSAKCYSGELLVSFLSFLCGLPNVTQVSYWSYGQYTYIAPPSVSEN